MRRPAAHNASNRPPTCSVKILYPYFFCKIERCLRHVRRGLGVQDLLFVGRAVAALFEARGVDLHRVARHRREVYFKVLNIFSYFLHVLMSRPPKSGGFEGRKLREKYRSVVEITDRLPNHDSARTSKRARSRPRPKTCAPARRDGEVQYQMCRWLKEKRHSSESIRCVLLKRSPKAYPLEYLYRNGTWECRYS